MKKTRRGANALVRIKGISLVKVQDILGLRKAKWLNRLVSALDSKVLGLIPGIVEPTLIRWQSDAEAHKLRTLKQAKTDADSYRAREMARAKADALVTGAQAVVSAASILRSTDGPDLYERTLGRLRAEELAHQINLESSIGLALEYIRDSNEAADKEVPTETISQEWVDQWIEGAKRASDHDLRILWARILGSATAGGENSVSLKLMETLRFVDAKMAKVFHDNAPQMYFTRFYCSGKPWDMAHLNDVGLLSRLDEAEYTISLQSCVVWIKFTPRYFHAPYRLSRMGSELFEALNPGARSMLRFARDSPRVRSRAGVLEKDVKDIFKNNRGIVDDVQYDRLGDQLSSLISGMDVPNLRIGASYLGKSAMTFHGEGNDYCMAFEATFDQAFAMTREEEGDGPIRIETDPALIDSLLRVVTNTDRRVIRKIMAATQRKEEFRRGEDGKLHRVIRVR